MISNKTIRSIIEEKIPFRFIQTGWFVGKGQCCNDYKERAGFKFEDGAIIFNCWNCGKTPVYEESSGKMSKKFREVLNAHGIDDCEINNIINSAFFLNKKKSENITIQSLTGVNTSTPEIAMPDGTERLGATDKHLDLQQSIVDYLISRNIDVESYPFFFNPNDRLNNRVIIPFYRNGKLIYWQARSILSNEKKRYDNSAVSREAVIFNFDELHRFDKSPLFITEGVFDALPLNGCALMGSSLNNAKIKLLSSSKRRLIFVIDKDKNGKKLAEKALECGWEITFSPNASKDVSDSIHKYGKLWTIFSLIKDVPADTDCSKLLISINCA